MIRRTLAAAALLGTACLGGPASAKIEPLPPYSTAYTPTTVDERGLWQQADEAERELRDSPAVMRDPALNAYVHGVLCRTVGEDRCKAARIYVVHVPSFNASMFPNGMLLVHSGLLLRVKSEAELAAVLGHEFGHFELRHSLQGFRNRRTTSDVVSWLGVLAPQERQLPMALYGLMFAHSRAQETEADMMGLRYMRAAGYRADAFPQIWERIMAEADATAAGRKRSVSHRYTADFFANHPTDLARATYLRKEIGGDGAAGDDRAAEFQVAMAPWRAQFLVDQIKRNDFGGSEYLLGQLAEGGWKPELSFARAELYRERGNPRDLVSAADFYRQAIDGGYADPVAWRGLGLSLLRAQQTEAGRVALSTYLQKSPQAADRSAMMMLIGPEGTH